MTGEELYNIVQKLETRKEQLEYIRNMTTTEKKEYEKYQTKLRQRKFNADANNRARMNLERKEYIAKLRAEQPVKMKEVNRIHNKDYRERLKTQSNMYKKIIATKAGNDLVNDLLGNINNMVDKSILDNKVKAKREAENIVKDLFEAVPKIVDKIENKRRVHNTRARAKLLKEGKEIPEELKPKRSGRPKKALK